MNLNRLSDAAIFTRMDESVSNERQATATVLHLLREVDRRRLYSKLKYQSLLEYMVKHQKYSEDQAWLRISAMKLLKEIPEIEPKINDGSLTLSNLNLARRVFLQEEKQAAAIRQANDLTSDTDSHSNSDSSPNCSSEAKPQVYQPRTPEMKIALLEKIENVSKREALKILNVETGVVITGNESERELSDGTVEIKSIVTKETLELIKELKGLWAHSKPNMKTGELLELALLALKEKKSPLAKAHRAALRPVPDQARRLNQKSNLSLSAKSEPRTEMTRYIPSAIRHAVWLRDEGKCTNCGSTNAPQYEHIVPVALRGQSTIENVKLLCRSCNQRAAIEVYGVRKMSRYLKAPCGSYAS